MEFNRVLIKNHDEEYLSLSNSSIGVQYKHSFVKINEFNSKQTELMTSFRYKTQKHLKIRPEPTLETLFPSQSPLLRQTSLDQSQNQPDTETAPSSSSASKGSTSKAKVKRGDRTSNKSSLQHRVPSNMSNPKPIKSFKKVIQYLSVMDPISSTMNSITKFSQIHPFEYYPPQYSNPTPNIEAAHQLQIGLPQYQLPILSTNSIDKHSEDSNFTIYSELVSQPLIEYNQSTLKSQCSQFDIQEVPKTPLPEPYGEEYSILKDLIEFDPTIQMVAVNMTELGIPYIPLESQFETNFQKIDDIVNYDQQNIVDENNNLLTTTTSSCNEISN